jgi:hypothetical protein
MPHLMTRYLFSALACSLLVACTGPAAESPTPSLPDLSAVARTSLYPFNCFTPGSRPGTLVTVENRGQADAPSFQIAVGDSVQTVDGLAAGQSEVVFFSDVLEGDTPGQFEVKVDPENTVAESNEQNNTYSGYVATLTPPVPCGSVTPLASCGNRTCDANENSSVCPEDCSEIQPTPTITPD